VRRTTITGLVSVDFGVSPFTPRDATTSRASGGVRLFEILDLTLGVRAVDGGTIAESPRAMPTFGLGLHGGFPRARWLALALGGEVGGGSAFDFYASGLLGLRVAPLRGLWLGLYPLHPVYTAWSEGRPRAWSALSTVDLTWAF